MIVALVFISSLAPAAPSAPAGPPTPTLLVIAVNATAPSHATATAKWLVSGSSVVHLQTIYGLDDTDSPDCVVCLCEPKSTVLLPCRHFVVCSSCHYRLDRCPICRAPISSFVQFHSEGRRPGHARTPPVMHV
eukprot:TRINITY_DN9606_c0_g1_i1.p1 TRINITY_DN9606_c0_g1~~TRINITY_DN9606_c0_g1_i1.p1  ORF type:complete len:133 (+),score=31.41 TRINITY_DN9606_c0_g1_i1:2-400(+)